MAAWWLRSRASDRARWPTRASRSGSIWRDLNNAVRHCPPCYIRPMPEPSPLTPIEIGLTAAIVTVEEDEPAILVAGDPEGAHKTEGEPRAGLPFGPFDPLAHRTFEIGLRAFVAAQSGLSVGYVEQLYTFGDRGRHARAG